MPTLGGRKTTSAGDSRAGWLGALGPHRARPCEEQARGREAPHRCLGSEPAHLLFYHTFLLRSARNRWGDYGDRAVAGAAVIMSCPVSTPVVPIPAPCGGTGISLHNFIKAKK